jgi:arylformamidase
MNKRINRRQCLKAIAISGPLVGSAISISDSFGQEAIDDTGPRVWLDMNQAQLNAAYEQADYAPNMQSVLQRAAHQNAAAQNRLGEPEKYAYGESPDEYVIVYRADKNNAPIQIYVHGGAWRFNTAEDYASVAEPIVNAGANVVLLNFSNADDEGISLGVLARQVRDATAWVYNNADKFGGNPEKIFVSGHSSGGHLAGVVLVTDWSRDYGLPENIIKGGLCCSGMFDLEAVRLSSRNAWLQLSNNEEQMLSAQRHINQISAPVIIVYGTHETPEFQRQSRDFAAAVEAAGKPVQLLMAEEYNHFEIMETFFSPYGIVGRALIEQMSLGSS